MLTFSAVAVGMALEGMSDVKRRYGSYDPEKWQTNLDLKMYFEDKMHFAPPVGH